MTFFDRQNPGRVLGWLIPLLVILPIPIFDAVSDYTEGTARFSKGSFNHFQEFRIRTLEGAPSCIRHHFEDAYHAAYNGTLKLLVRSIGFMPGSYTGPMPARKRAGEIMNSKATVLDPPTVEQNCKNYQDGSLISAKILLQMIINGARRHPLTDSVDLLGYYSESKEDYVFLLMDTENEKVIGHY